ncbi:MAG: cytochrome c4 [Gammaproteobacteria bacterium]|nr:cytochrome c4 [Gammaproteobacteria bacterium]
MTTSKAITFCVGIGVATGCVTSVAVAEEPHFKWSRQTLALIASGNKEQGAEVADKHRCQKCHGDTGVSDESDTPSIAGQIAAYQFKQLMDYKNGTRNERQMEKIARKLTPEDMADLAAFYAAQTPATPAGVTAAPQMVTAGDMGRLLLPCDVCHGKQGEGLGAEVPALAGQSNEYLMTTLTEFKEGERQNDHYGRMRYIAKQLTDEEIEALVAYYAAPVPKE